MNKKKIALIRSTYSPYGGAETLTEALTHKLLEYGASVSLLTLPDQPWDIAHSDLKIIHLGSPIRERLWQLWRFEQSVCSYLKGHPFDAIFAIDRVSCFTHFHAGGGSHRTFLRIKNQDSSLMARLFRKVSLFHASTVHIEKKGFANPRLKKIHCCSKMVADDLCNDYGLDRDKCQIIYNGINWQDMGSVFEKRAAVAADLYEAHALAPDQKYLLFLGSGFERKGLDVAISGLAYLPESYHLIVVGQGSYKAYHRLSERLGVKQRVHFLGPLKDGWRYAAICKGLVLPSRYEPFGLAAAEAQAMGLPVLVSDRTGYKELVSAGETGVILQYPAAGHNIRQAVVDFQRIIESSVMNAEQIRERISHLDNAVIFKKIIEDFLEL
jgi:UDP-glucose:(heptosyl)LPS alpha-1,3-glucosyltransferase